MNNKQIFLQETPLKLKKGIDIVANAVKVTLGYGGRTVVISETGMPSRMTKDGVTVANSIKLRDEIDDAGAKMTKEVSAKTAEIVGDGTTTVCILLQAMVEEGLKHLAAGSNPVRLKKGMELAVELACKELDAMKKNVDDKIIKQVAAVSANNDMEIGNMVGDTYGTIGKYGSISIEPSPSDETTMKIIDGFQIDTGYLGEWFINNPAKLTCDIEEPYILVAEGKISDIEEVWPLMVKTATEKRGLVIIAEDFDFTVPQTFLKNIKEKGFVGCLIKYNFLGDTKQEMMHDICAMTGATVAESKGAKLRNIDVSYLGHCEKISIGKDDTTIFKGNKTEEAVQKRIQDAKVKIDNAKHQYIRQKQERRIAKLNGGIAICYVGGATEVEISEKMDRVDDSVRATKAAIEEGVVIGAGTALLKARKALFGYVKDDEDLKAGVKIIYTAMEAPAQQIFKNVGEKFEESDNDEFGYNAATDRIENLFNAGIVDPLKVVKTCLRNAASAAAQVLTSQALIVTDNS